jgi:NADPH-dependent glutamate synthase beta subunit-like oxidoreductase
MQTEQNQANKHYVAIIGGSVSGSEAATMLAEKGYKVVVFDQNELPYGKLEDGLPMWHASLRDRQEEMIDEKLDHPNITYLPLVQVGKDVNFSELASEWGFSAVILANGAWDDRPLNLKEIHQFEGKNLVYQNPFLYWFNHKHESDYEGKRYKIQNRAVVLGGGLASIDVMKIIMIELVIEGLEKHKDIEVDVFTLEKKGIKEILELHNTTLEEIGVEPGYLVYRRSAEDMPLAQPSDDTPEKNAKARETSKNLIEKYVDKFLFHFVPQAVVEDDIIENGKFEGLKFRKMATEGKNLVATDETFEIRTQFVVSSIGSIPKKIEGLPYDGEKLKMNPNNEFNVDGFDNVFAIGNAITGKGNIMSSKKHGKEMTAKIISEHLDELGDIYTNDQKIVEKLNIYNTALKELMAEELASIENSILKQKIISTNDEVCLIDKTSKFNKDHQFSNYRRWIAEHKPVRLENLLGLSH